jgi:hypothetical protein
LALKKIRSSNLQGFLRDFFDRLQAALSMLCAWRDTWHHTVAVNERQPSVDGCAYAA